LFQREGDEDILRLVSLADGKVRWRTAFPATYRRGIDPDAGPRCVPQILEDCVLVHAASGAVHCVELADGRVRWTRALRKEYGAEDGYFGAGTAPLVVGPRVIVNVGAKKKGAGIVAISLADGKTLWQSTEADAGYASPILMPSSGEGRTAGGVAVVPTRLTTYGLDVETGKVLWEFPFGQRGPTVNAATPIPISTHSLLQTSSYGIGYVTVDLGSGGAKILVEGMELASQYASPVAVGGLVFGADGREDAGGASYKCLDPLQGKIRWESTGLPICHTIVFGESVFGDGKALVDGKRDAPASATLLLVGIDGQVGAAPASADGLQWKWRTRLPAGVYRALPAWSSGRLVVRTTGDRGAKWYCFEL
jgi:outer membrane protein assembly factor BamB